MPKVLLNYRREDTAPYAGRIADRLRQEFGPDHVFVDIDTIRPGEDFIDAIDRSLASSDVVIALVGKSWLSARDDGGKRRLDRADDFVRMELAKALERGVRVIPTLVGGAAMPEAKDLPHDIAALSRRHAIEISDGRFHQDVDRLIASLRDGTVRQPPPARGPDRPSVDAPRMRVASPMWWVVIVGTALLAVVAYLAFASWERTAPERAEAALEAPARAPAPPPAVDTPEPAPRQGVAAPGSEVARPSPRADAPGMTGIRILWRGAHSVPCYLYDGTGEKLLSPGGVVSAWRCEKEGRSWDAAPGRYQLRIGGVAGTVEPIPLTVSAGRVTAIEPPVGQLTLHWRGSNRVRWYLLDKSGEKTLSPQGVVNAWDVYPGKSSTVDLGPGEYTVRVDAVGYQPVPARVAAFRVTEITLP